MIFYNNHKQIVGELKDGIFRKKVKRSVHHFRIFDAWGIDKKIIEKLKGDCDEIRIVDIETGNMYCTAYEVYVKHGIPRDFDTPQLFLPLDKFAVTSIKQKKLI